MVLSSYLWDIHRWTDRFPRLPPHVWGAEFEANYSAVARALHSETVAARSHLFLTIPFPLLHRPLDRMAWQSGLPHRIHALALQLGVPLIDLSRPFLRSPLLAIGVDVSNEPTARRRPPRNYRTPAFVDNASVVYYRDISHQSLAGSEALWAHILAAVTHTNQTTPSIRANASPTGTPQRQCPGIRLTRT